ncbi:MAG: putative DNA polymerase [Prokaryotic dsDNA virus sp.]|nr:MAG: putative DNA polymerase [Prokaryotic dsDNA virus sp.]
MNIEGAKCELCSLGKHWRTEDKFTPVLAETHSSDRIAIIGDTPGTHEEFEGRPFVGPAGQEIQLALNEVGIVREDCLITYAISCRPPQNRLDTFMVKHSRANKVLRKEKKPLLLTPAVACRGRLLREIEGCKYIICLGAEAMRTLRGGNASITSMRGACEELDLPWGKARVSYTLDPSFVLRSPKWRPVFQRDIGKALRFFEGKLDWKDPELFFPTTPQEVSAGFKRLVEMGKPIAYDVETDAKNPLNAQLRCVGFANTSFSMIVPFLSIDGTTRFFTATDEDIVSEMTREFLGNPPLPLLGHNAGQYDRLVCEKFFGVTPRLDADTLLLHLLSDNEMPHNLGFVTSFYSDFTEAWKADHTAVDARSDLELHTYCAKDCAVTAKVSRPLGKCVKDRNQWHLLQREHRLQQIGTSMQSLGMYVDFNRLHEHEVQFQEKLRENRKLVTDLAPENFNPNSTTQLRALIFKDWKLAPVKYNEKTGDPSTDDDTLRKMITKYNLDEERAVFLQAVRMCRRYTKLLSTYITPFKTDLVLSDGRVHPAYNRLPATGRYSSSAPNAQNIPGFLRDIFIPQPGHVFVGADADQLELRFIAEEAKADRLVKSINTGADPHNETMEIVYGQGIWSLDGAPKERHKKGKGTFKATRGVTKSVRYAWQYAASVPTIHEQVISVEDEAGSLIYAHMTPRDIRAVVNGLNRADPEIPKWWNEIRNRYRREGFIADAIWGRRRDFRDEEKINELVNHPIQAGGASVIHEAMLELVDGNPGWGTSSTLGDSSEIIKFDFEKKTGLVNQCHDSLLFEVPESEGERVAEILEAAMTRRRRVEPLLTYTAEAEVGMNWLEV